MAELDRVLDVLLHDLRSPLSVASGYVRLLRLERLDSFEARDKAWTQTATALTRIAHMCDEAVGFLSSAQGVRRPVPVTGLVARVRQRCLEAGLILDEEALTASGDTPMLQWPADVDQLAKAITALAAPHHSAVGPPRVRVALTADQLTVQFVISASEPDIKPDTKAAEPFDPWQTPGLSAALACHVITLASGQVESAHDLIISFPLLESPS
jgi:signal transduction histidine kinase